MKERLAMREYITDTQRQILVHGGFEHDSEPEYLLGFERDKVRSLPVKTYIRRLWLPFQSGKGSLPRHFLGPRVVDFVAHDINPLVNRFVKYPEELTAELDKQIIDLVDGDVRDCGFLADRANHILVDRNWGDQLWGSHPWCVYANSKPEPEHNTAPVWPQDKNR